MQKETFNFSRSLHRIRLSKKLSQGDVTRVLGIHRNHISGLERGARNHSPVTIQKAVKTLGVSPTN